MQTSIIRNGSSHDSTTNYYYILVNSFSHMITPFFCLNNAQRICYINIMQVSCQNYDLDLKENLIYNVKNNIHYVKNFLHCILRRILMHVNPKDIQNYMNKNYVVVDNTL